jgi:hypothetical protein
MPRLQTNGPAATSGQPKLLAIQLKTRAASISGPADAKVQLMVAQLRSDRELTRLVGVFVAVEVRPPMIKSRHGPHDDGHLGSSCRRQTLVDPFWKQNRLPAAGALQRRLWVTR